MDDTFFCECEDTTQWNRPTAAPLCAADTALRKAILIMVCCYIKVVIYRTELEEKSLIVDSRRRLALQNVMKKKSFHPVSFLNYRL